MSSNDKQYNVLVEETGVKEKEKKKTSKKWFSFNNKKKTSESNLTQETSSSNRDSKDNHAPDPFVIAEKTKAPKSAKEPQRLDVESNKGKKLIVDTGKKKSIFQKLKGIFSKRRESVNNWLRGKIEAYVHRMLRKYYKKIKGDIEEKKMNKFFKEFANDLVDEVWPDVEEEFVNNSK